MENNNETSHSKSNKCQCKGLMVLVGFGQTDTEKEVEYLARKLCKLRIFPDDEGRMNKSVQDIGGKLLLVPQFTLYGKTKKNRPSFHKALAILLKNAAKMFHVKQESLVHS